MGASRRIFCFPLYLFFPNIFPGMLDFVLGFVIIVGAVAFPIVCSLWLGSTVPFSLFTLILHVRLIQFSLNNEEK